MAVHAPLMIGGNTYSILCPDNILHVLQTGITNIIQEVFSNTIYLTVSVETDLDYYEGVHGYCENTSLDWNNPCSFKIRINKSLDADRFLYVLFHELAHVLQYLRGDFSVRNHQVFYKGILLDEVSESPWEKEADEIVQQCWNNMGVAAILKLQYNIQTRIRSNVTHV